VLQILGIWGSGPALRKYLSLECRKRGFARRNDKKRKALIGF